MRRSLTIAAAVVVIGLGVSLAMSVVAPPSTDHVAPERSDDPEFVELEGSESTFWPYLSSQRSFRKGSAVNVIARADAETVLRRMQDDTDREWDEADEHEHDAGAERYSVEEIDPGAGTAIRWGDATGSTRYAYVDDDARGNGAGWVEETYQINHGDYYGHRYHIRLYEAPAAEDEWTIMQAHTEHFDWFTLRHAVHGNEEAQRRIELDFMGQPFVEEVWRKHAGNDEPYDSDGWVTVVEFAVLLPAALVGALGRDGTVRRRGRDLWRRLDRTDRRRLRAAYRRITPRHLQLFGAVLGLVLGVRVAGVLIERYVSVLSMHGIAALLYPFLAVGIPVATVAVARGMTRRMDAAVAATLGLSAGVLLDFSALGVSVLPVEIVAHRAGLVVALGLFAAGVVERSKGDERVNDWLVVGATLWIGLLAVSLFGLL